MPGRQGAAAGVSRGAYSTPVQKSKMEKNLTCYPVGVEALGSRGIDGNPSQAGEEIPTVPKSVVSVFRQARLEGKKALQLSAVLTSF